MLFVADPKVSLLAGYFEFVRLAKGVFNTNSARNMELVVSSLNEKKGERSSSGDKIDDSVDEQLLKLEGARKARR